MLNIARPIGLWSIEPNDSITVNTVIELRDAIFDETRFSSIPLWLQLIIKDMEMQWK